MRSLLGIPSLPAAGAMRATEARARPTTIPARTEARNPEVGHRKQRWTRWWARWQVTYNRWADGPPSASW
eukprot:2046400-Prymnesium_polylepis.2